MALLAGDAGIAAAQVVCLVTGQVIMAEALVDARVLVAQALVDAVRVGEWVLRIGNCADKQRPQRQHRRQAGNNSELHPFSPRTFMPRQYALLGISLLTPKAA